VRLENKTLPKLEDLFKINYEYLMILKYKDFYRDSKDIIKFDDSIITKYYQSSLIVQSNQHWECIYIDTDKMLELLRPPYLVPELEKVSSLMINLMYSILLKKSYPKLYHCKHRWDSPYSSLLLYKFLIENKIFSET